MSNVNRDPVELQKAYWTANAREKTELLARYPDGLSWAELLRLHHLNAIELAAGDDGKFETRRDQTPATPAYTLYLELIEKLLAPESPYRVRHVLVWQGDLDQQRPPNFTGGFRNASATHLGCLEVLRLDAQNRPTAITFVPYDDIHMIIFAGPALFRAARLIYDTGQPDEIVFVPLLYGLSWFTNNPYDKDGSMTRFALHAARNNENIAVGFGHQDFQVSTDDGGLTVFGLGSVGQISTALEMADPRFEQKCRARGIDPNQIHRR